MPFYKEEIVPEAGKTQGHRCEKRRQEVSDLIEQCDVQAEIELEPPHLLEADLYCIDLL